MEIMMREKKSFGNFILSEFTCEGKADGNYADPNDCSIFHQCVNGNDTVQQCSSGTLFNGSICDWDYNVTC